MPTKRSLRLSDMMNKFWFVCSFLCRTNKKQRIEFPSTVPTASMDKNIQNVTGRSAVMVCEIFPDVVFVNIPVKLAEVVDEFASFIILLQYRRFYQSKNEFSSRMKSLLGKYFTPYQCF